MRKGPRKLRIVFGTQSLTHYRGVYLLHRFLTPIGVNRSLGHQAIGLDGSKELVEMARRFSGCEVLHQDFLALELPENRFDGVFANASLFHVPSQELPRVLRQLHATLKPDGVLFCSNPRGADEEGMSGNRFACFFALDTWRAFVTAAGFTELEHYSRPPGLPRHQPPWLATVWRRRQG